MVKKLTGRKKILTNWKNKMPKSYYFDCVKMFGPPDAISNTEGGMCIWYDKGELFREHILRDEQVAHCVPRPHHDYFYSSIYFYVPPDKLLDVLRISGSINYDGLKKLLTARCGGINANYATLYLAMQLVNGELTIDDIKRNDMYPKMIRGEIMPHSEMAEKMIDMKRANNKMYVIELEYEYATYAYDSCYEDKPIVKLNDEQTKKAIKRKASLKSKTKKR
jgi:hypothetical protein